MRSGRRRFAVVLCLTIVIVAIGVQGARQLGWWLAAEDPLERASAIVVLGGGFPFRAVEAASLYEGGWAPQLWLVRPRDSEREAALARLGLAPFGGEEASNAAVLERLGVPPAAIRVLSRPVRATADEVRAVAEEMASRAGSSVILVTSKPHARRVRATWRALVGRTPRATVRYAAGEMFDAAHWWRNTTDALAVAREVLGLMNLWAGLPVSADRHAP